MLGKLPSIIFPWSFPPDPMHLLFENGMPKMMDVDVDDDGSQYDDQADDESSEAEVAAAAAKRARPKRRLNRKRADVTAPTHRRQKRKADGAGDGPAARKPGKKDKKKKKDDPDAKFRATSDPWNIPVDAWLEMSRHIEESRPLLPHSVWGPSSQFCKALPPHDSSPMEGVDLPLGPCLLEAPLTRRGLCQVLELGGGLQAGVCIHRHGAHHCRPRSSVSTHLRDPY